MTTLLPVIAPDFFDPDKRPKAFGELIKHGAGLGAYQLWKTALGEKVIKALYREKFRLVIDSGAFTEFTEEDAGKKKTTISMKDYVAFLRKFEKYIETYINLDKIGNPDLSQKRFNELVSLGFKPMPVFHHKYTGVPQGFQYLKDCMKTPGGRFDVVGLGGMVRVDSSELRKWHRRIANYLSRLGNHISTDRVFHIKRFHALGVLAPDVLRREHFFYADSRSVTFSALQNETYYVWDDKHCRLLTINRDEIQNYADPARHSLIKDRRAKELFDAQLEELKMTYADVL